MLKMLEAVAALEAVPHQALGRADPSSAVLDAPAAGLRRPCGQLAIRPGDMVLEPSAGTGMLAVMAECALGKQAAGNLHLNEIAETRRALLCRLYPRNPGHQP